MSYPVGVEWTPIFQNIASEFTQGDNWHLQLDNTIIADQPNSGWKQYIRNTVATFKCSKCGRSWPSNRVMVVFHFRLSRHQGTIKIRAFRQNCKKCNNAPMENPSIKISYIENLMENLVNNIRKKCYREDLDDRQKPHVGVEVRSPHEPDHCEGCMAGVCNRDTSLPNLFANLNLR